MGLFDNIFGNSTANNFSFNNSSATSESGPESWMRTEGQNATSLAVNNLPFHFTPYGGQRVADYGSDYGAGKNKLAEMDYRSGHNYEEAKDRLSRLWGSASKALQTDARGYMNPYTDTVLGTQLRKLDEARKGQLNEDRRAATMAGAFGDPQAGIAKALSNDRYNTLTADTTGKTMSDAFDKGNQMREADLARLFGVTDRRSALDSSKFGEDSQIAKARVNFGQADQALAQKKLDVDYDNWLKKQGWAVSRAQTINALLNGTPHNTQSASTGQGNGMSQYPTPNYGAQAIGQVAGSALGGGFGEKLGDWLFG